MNIAFDDDGPMSYERFVGSLPRGIEDDDERGFVCDSHDDIARVLGPAHYEGE